MDNLESRCRIDEEVESAIAAPEFTMRLVELGVDSAYFIYQLVVTKKHGNEKGGQMKH